MASYRLTAARRVALRKAQMVSARMRRGRRKFSGRKLTRGHKRAIGVVAAGAIVSAGVYKYTSSRNRPVQMPPGAKHSSLVPYDGRGQRTPYNDNPGWHSKRDKNSAAAKSNVIQRTESMDVFTTVQHPFAKAIMNEIHGKPIRRRRTSSLRKGGRYKVIYGERPDVVVEPEPQP